MSPINPLLTIVFAACLASTYAQAQHPLPSAHAHNDYLHRRPLLDALDHGFTSVEADIFLVDGQLLVAHEVFTLKPDRTLESLYLKPLAERVKKNDGQVHKDGERFLLLIDIKSEPESTYQQLAKLLAAHADVLTTVEDGKLRPGAVTVIITGNQPRESLTNANPRYAGFDGRLSDLDSDAPAHLMPMISDRWGAHFTWTGNGPMPPVEEARLKQIVSKAHAAGRIVRFWATPEKQAVWSQLRACGVDLIGTDQLDQLAAFLRR